MTPASHKSAFTFLELMVTISLLVLILTISTVSYRTVSKRNELILVANQLADDIRAAENFAASAKGLPNKPVNNIWLIKLEPVSGSNTVKSYQIGATNNSNQAQPDSSLDFSGLNSNFVAYQTVQLPREIEIDAYGYKDGSGSLIPLFSDVMTDPVGLIGSFWPPRPKVYIIDNSSPTNATYDNLYITLKDTANNSTQTVIVNSFGLVDVER